MDLLKEEKRLIEKLVKARENVERKGKYLAKSQRSFMIAQREVKTASVRVRKIREKIKAQLETGIPLNEESAKLVEKIHESTELADVEVEENAD